MKLTRYILSAALMLLATLGLNAQFMSGSSVLSALDDTECVADLKNHVEFFSSASLQGRAPGSEGEKEAAAYLWEELKSAGIEMLCGENGDLFGIKDGADTLTSRNVVGYLHGYDKDLCKRYIVIGAHLDNLGVNQLMVNGEKETQIYYGANSNASGLAMMIELAKRIKINNVLFSRNVIFVGFGAETKGMAGAYYFLSNFFKKDLSKIDAMINLDCLGTEGEEFYAYTSSCMDMNKILLALNSDLYPYKPQITAEEIYPSDHRAFYSFEIPSVHFSTGRFVEHNTFRDVASALDYNKMEALLEYIYSTAKKLANVVTPPSFSKDEELTKINVNEFDDVISFFDATIPPMFLNSPDPQKFLSEWVYKYLRYPEEAVKEGISGKVTVGFIVEQDGSVSNVRIVKSAHPLLDDEALRIVEASPKWKAGRLNGQKVRVALNINIEFRLRGKGTSGFGINGIKIGNKKN